MYVVAEAVSKCCMKRRVNGQTCWPSCAQAVFLEKSHFLPTHHEQPRCKLRRLARCSASGETTSRHYMDSLRNSARMSRAYEERLSAIRSFEQKKKDVEGEVSPA
jgi:hypothetical protein